MFAPVSAAPALVGLIRASDYQTPLTPHLLRCQHETQGDHCDFDDSLDTSCEEPRRTPLYADRLEDLGREVIDNE